MIYIWHIFLMNNVLDLKKWDCVCKKLKLKNLIT